MASSAMEIGYGTGQLPFADGSVSLGLHPGGHTPGELIAGLVDQAVAAERAGFVGVTLGEHHGGYPGYLPNPLLAASWLLGSLKSAWVGAAPLLLPLRRTGTVIEDAAWSAARYPGRLGLALAPGYLTGDFNAAGAPFDTRGADFRVGLSQVCPALGSGIADGALGEDAAVRACAKSPIPVLAAAAGPQGMRRAAAAGAGVLIGAFDPPERVRELIDEYRAAGGAGPRVLIRRVWVGRPSPERLESMLSAYTAQPGEQSFLRTATPDSIVHSEDGAEIADRLRSIMVETGATALNIRLVMPDATDDELREQIERAGAEVLPAFALTGESSTRIVQSSV